MRVTAAIGVVVVSLLTALARPAAPVTASVPTTPYYGNDAQQTTVPGPHPEEVVWTDLLGPTYGPMAYAMADDYGLPHWLVRNLIWVESKGDPGAASETADHGLMQLNDNTWPTLAERLSLEDPNPYDVSHNLQMGMFLLASLHAKYGDWTMALTAYNRGETGMLRLLEQTGSADSDYSRNVMEGR